MFKSGGSGDGGAAAARADEAARQARIREGAQSINSLFDQQFTDDFYSGIETAYTDYASPQLDRQFEDAKKQLAFALDRAGLGQSSVAAQRSADLNTQLGEGQLQIADQARQYSARSRSDIEAARSGLLSQNTATADPAAAALAAQSRAAALNTRPAFSPLAQLFETVTAGLATQRDLEERGRARFNTGLFTPAPGSGGASRVVT